MVNVTSAVCDAVGVTVSVGTGVFVVVGSGVAVSVAVAVGAGGKIRFTTRGPKMPDTNAKTVNTAATINHCQPVAVYAWRVR